MSDEVKFYALEPEWSYAKGQFFFVVCPDGRLHLNFGKGDNQISAEAAQMMGPQRSGFPQHLYTKDLINAFELGRAVERGDAKPYEVEDEGF